ncbi:hypothetical protein [Streptomyces sp. NPDC046985]|uniref:hypothetical protein n=1 Tax=Streptomyces sp. NPDC046985 TaxID=3155377 RepID=UPI0033C7A721
MRRRHVSRGAASAAAVLALAAGALVAGTPTASASTCGGPSDYLCGAAKNRSGRTMSLTLNLGAGGGYCDVWNWGGGTSESFKHARCDQQTFGNGTKGGNGTGVDVDAFTFAGYGYHERFSRVGTWHWRQKGVWTKVRDEEIADCGIGDGNEIWCTVLLQ